MLGQLEIPLDIILQMICFNPRKIFNLKSIISVGEKADLTIFNADHEYNFTEENIKSKSSNTPLLGKKLKGVALATILGDKINVN